MAAFDAGFVERWQAAVTSLKMQAARVQATADDLPPSITLENGRALRRDPSPLLRRHQMAIAEQMTALVCLQAIMREFDLDGM